MCSSSSDGNGDGGSGGTTPDEVEAISFDDENAIPVASANAVAVAVSAELGTLLGSALGALAEGATGFAEGTSAKQQGLDVACPGGGIVALSYGTIAIGEEATLEFTDCVGSVFSASALNGTITLDIEAVLNTGLGDLPSEGTATVDLRTADGNTTITGMFKVIVPFFSANLPLEFGNDLQTDMLRIERNTGQGAQTIEFRCFRIRMTIALGFSSAPSITSGTIVDGSFEPTGIAILNGTDVFTLGTREPLSFTGAVARAGSLENTTGNQRASVTFPGFCDGIGLTMPGDGSFVAVEFANEQCVAVSGIDANNETFEYGTTWAKLINADFTPSNSTCGTQGTTPAVEGPADCNIVSAFEGEDRLPVADTFINGNGPEGNRSGENFGTNTVLLAKSVSNLYFTRKIYLVFDIETAPAELESATLVLTLDRHVEIEGRPPEVNGPQPFNVYGITDGDDWDGDDPPETGLTWDNAPKNLDDWRVPFEDTEGVPLLVSQYDFDVGGDGVVDPPGTRYAFDLTEYVQGRIDDPQDDGRITVLIAHFNPTTLNVDTSRFFSKETTTGDCDRPFLRLVPAP